MKNYAIKRVISVFLSIVVVLSIFTATGIFAFAETPADPEAAAAAPHEHIAITVPRMEPTCTESGWTEYKKCSVCDQILDDGGHELLAINHPVASLIPNVGQKDASCKEAGYTGDLVCGICGEIISAGKVVPKMSAHQLTELKNFVSATCTSTGYSGDVYCYVCKEIVEQGHVTPKVTVGVDHTDICPKDHICDDCGTVISKHVNSDGSHYCDYCGVELSKCVDLSSDHFCDICGKRVSVCVDADQSHFCDLCGKKLSECADIAKDHLCDYCGMKLTNHKYHVIEEHSADCVTGAYIVKKCDYCGDVLKIETAPAIGHDLATFEVYPTCTEDGSVTVTCLVCGFTDTEVIPAMGHVTMFALSSTPACRCPECTCFICGETYVDARVVPDDHVDSNGDHVCDMCGEDLPHSSGEFRCSMCDRAENSAKNNEPFAFLISFIHMIKHFFESMKK